jgi:hypothetical protein
MGCADGKIVEISSREEASLLSRLRFQQRPTFTRMPNAT